MSLTIFTLSNTDPLGCGAPRSWGVSPVVRPEMCDAGTFFNRVIDDGKGSDNTRHLAHAKKTGKPYLQPAQEICRVLLCCGQIYYHLSRVRRSRRIDNIVLVRLEQVAPFPFDIVLRIMQQYSNAEICWVQEEPKNQGAWAYVR
jgi:2-oxoglutarate dehydrogenase E1 component